MSESQTGAPDTSGRTAYDMLHAGDEEWGDILDLTAEERTVPDDEEMFAVEEQAEADATEAPVDTGDPDGAGEDEAAEAAEVEPDTEAEEGAEAPDGAEVKAEEPKAEAEAPKPIADFTVFDAEGAVEVPPLEIEFKANGAVRKMGLDRVVRLAQSGFYNEEMQEQIRAFREAEPAFKQTIEQEKALASRQAALLREILENEEAYLARRDEYQRSHTPEARLARAEADRRTVEARLHAVENLRQTDAFLSQVGPKVEAVLAQYPTVTEEEASGWLAPQLKRLERQGQIPVSRLADVERLVTVDLPEWLAGRHESRTTQAAQAETKRQLSLRKLQVEVAKAKQPLARKVAPSRVPQVASTRREPTRAPASAREAVDAFFASEAGR